MPVRESNDYKLYFFALMLLAFFVAAWYFDWLAALSDWFKNMNSVLG